MPDETTPTEPMVPKARLDEKNQQIAKLQAQVAEYEPLAKQTQTLADHNAQLQSQLTAAQETHSRYRSLAAAGFADDSAVEYLEFRYTKDMATLPKKEQVPIGEWLQARLDDPSVADPVTQALFAARTARTADETTDTEAPPAESPPSTEQPPTTTRSLPASNTGARQPPNTRPPDAAKQLFEIVNAKDQSAALERYKELRKTEEFQRLRGRA